jgi:hypothetical protein
MIFAASPMNCPHKGIQAWLAPPERRSSAGTKIDLKGLKMATNLKILKVFLNEESMKVPQAEAFTLDTLIKLAKPANGVEIARASKDVIKLGAVYQLANRLEKRQLVRRSETWDATGGIPIRRVNYTPVDGIKIVSEQIHSTSSQEDREKIDSLGATVG